MGKPKQQGRWPLIRVSQRTHERLYAEIERLVGAIESNRTEDIGMRDSNNNPNVQSITFDQMIQIMLDARDDHRERRKVSNKKRSKREAQRRGQTPPGQEG